jgi:hypothetical protein
MEQSKNPFSRRKRVFNPQTCATIFIIILLKSIFLLLFIPIISYDGTSSSFLFVQTFLLSVSFVQTFLFKRKVWRKSLEEKFGYHIGM